MAVFGMKIWQVQEADSWSPFLVSISVYFWEFINEIKSVEAVDVFAFFEWASDFENGRWIIDEGLVENVFGSNKTFSFGQLAWPTVWSTAKAAPRFTMKSICERGEDDFKVHFWVSFLRVWRWLFEWALGGYMEAVKVAWPESTRWRVRRRTRKMRVDWQ